MAYELTQELLDEALIIGKAATDRGTVASYIPELAKVDAEDFGICVMQKDGSMLHAGEVNQRFSIQSVSKTIVLAAAISEFGLDKVFTYVKMEPSGDSFNSILKLDLTSNLPYNPYINAGAIQITGLLSKKFKFEDLLDYSKKLCLDDEITLNLPVYESEAATGDRNRAIAYLLKSKDVLHADCDEVTDFYFKMCSLNVSAKSLAGLGAVLANGGVNPITNERLMEAETARIVTTLMFTCGTYDESGEIAVKVGIPAKSGVGGGIVLATKTGMGIGVYGPSLDKKGNSIAGIKALEYISKELHLHTFEY